MKTKEEFEEKLIAGTKIKIGKKYSEQNGFLEGEIITLVDLQFEYDNDFGGGFEDAPGVMNEKINDPDSIYHLFGNNFEYWMDNTIVE